MINQQYICHKYKQLLFTLKFFFVQIIINRYTFNRENLIGSGSFGDCYKSIDTQTNQAVVLKIIPIQSSKIDPFSDEASLLENLHHDHLCQGIEHFIMDNNYQKVQLPLDQSFTNAAYQFVIVMKYYPNQDIAQYLSNHQVDEKTKYQWAIQISDAVAYLHSKHLIHRDLKLQNIFLSEDLQCYLGDFGTLKQLETGKLTQTQVFTIQTCSPEQIDNKPYDERTDLFSLGCLIYELFEGKSPFCFSGNFAEAVERISKVQYDECQCQNDKIKTVIHNLLQLQPENRWAASHVYQFLSGDGGSASSVPNVPSNIHNGSIDRNGGGSDDMQQMKQDEQPVQQVVQQQTTQQQQQGTGDSSRDLNQQHPQQPHQQPTQPSVQQPSQHQVHQPSQQHHTQQEVQQLAQAPPQQQITKETLIQSQITFKTAIKQKLTQIFNGKEKLQKFITFIENLYLMAYSGASDGVDMGISNNVSGVISGMSGADSNGVEIEYYKEVKNKENNLQQKYEIIQQIKGKYLQDLHFDEKTIKNVLFFVDFIIFE